MIHWVGWRNEPRKNGFLLNGHGFILQMKEERVNIRPRNLSLFLIFISFKDFIYWRDSISIEVK